MKGIILAAGLGTRLRPYTDTLPKPLIQVGGRPLIYYNLMLLKKYGIVDVSINLHHFGDKIVQELGDGSKMGMQIRYSQEDALLGTGGGIKKMASSFPDEACVVINGDIVIEIELDRLLARHRDKKGSATLVLRADKNLSQFGILEIDAEDRIRNILNKTPWNGFGKRQLMFTGLHVIEKKVLDYIPANGFYSITEAYIAMLQENKQNLFAYVSEGYWNDLGHVDRYRSVDRALLEGKLKISHMG